MISSFSNSKKKLRKEESMSIGSVLESGNPEMEHSNTIKALRKKKKSKETNKA
jgi:hypothetical protein